MQSYGIGKNSFYQPFNFITMGEKVFIVSVDGQIGATNLSFEEVSEILATAAANKNKFEAGVSEKELNESAAEFCFALICVPKISTKILGKGLEMKEIHRKSLSYAKSKGISLVDLFSDLDDMSDDDLSTHLKTIFGVDFQ